ncbi:MAG: RNA processing protein [Marteilia pararefringens]
MLPFSLLKSSINHPISIELNSRETYNGHLSEIDRHMNVRLADAILTSASGDRFKKIADCWIRGNAIKNFRITSKLLDDSSQKRRLDSIN